MLFHRTEAAKNNDQSVSCFFLAEFSSFSDSEGIRLLIRPFALSIILITIPVLNYNTQHISKVYLWMSYLDV